MTPNAPCKDCVDRHGNCHSTCDKYNTWKISWDKERQQISEGRIRYAELTRIRNESIARAKKRNKV